MKPFAIIGLLALALLLVGTALASGGYDLAWWTVDDGGATFSAGGGYTLGGTAGQPDAGQLGGAGYTLGGGFWGGGAAVGGAPSGYTVRLPLVVR